MTGLPKSIIKKYGVTKRAWAEFRKGRKTRKKLRGMKHMAKKHKTYHKRGGMDPLITTAVSAMAYGAMREKVSTYIQPFTSKIPVLGNYSDEVCLGVAGYLLAKGKVPYLKGDMARGIGRAALIIESARVGSGLVNGVGFK